MKLVKLMTYQSCSPFIGSSCKPCHASYSRFAGHEMTHEENGERE